MKLIAAILLAGMLAFAVVSTDDEPAVDGDVWLHMVDGGNGPIFTPIRDDVTNLWTACVGGDLYTVLLHPAIEGYLNLSVTEDYEHWCPGAMSTDHSPFMEADS